MNKVKKKVVFICAGPDYLFFTSGIYYLWELSLLYKVVLLVDYPSENFEIYERLKKDGKLHDFYPIYYSRKSSIPIINRILKHQYYNKISRYLFNIYNPIAILQHSDIEPQYIYFFAEAYTRKIKRILYKASMVLANPNGDFELMKPIHVVELKRKWNIPLWAAASLFRIKMTVGHLIKYKAIPVIVRGHIFKPRINLFGFHKQWYNYSHNYYDYSLTHSKKEKMLLSEVKEKATIIKFPLFTIGNEVNDYLYGSVQERDLLLVLPTDGEIDHMMQTKCISLEDAYNHWFDFWIEVIGLLCEKFPSHEVAIKFKLKELQDEFKKRSVSTELSGMVTYVDANEDTQKLLLKSNIVVSTMSTVLWWVAFLNSKKTLISLDLMNIPFGDYFRDVERVYYFNTIESLREFEFERQSSVVANVASGITLSKFMAGSIGK